MFDLNLFFIFVIVVIIVSIIIFFVLFDFFKIVFFIENFLTKILGMPRNKTQSILYGLHYARTVRVFCKVKGVSRSYIYILAAMVILSNRGKKLKKTSIYLLMFYNGFFKDYTAFKNNFDEMIS